MLSALANSDVEIDTETLILIIPDLATNDSQIKIIYTFMNLFEVMFNINRNKVERNLTTKILFIWYVDGGNHLVLVPG